MYPESAIRCTASVKKVTYKQSNSTQVDTVELNGEDAVGCIPFYVGMLDVTIHEDQWAGLKVSDKDAADGVTKCVDGCVIDSHSDKDNLKCVEPPKACEAMTDEATCKQNQRTLFGGKATRCRWSTSSKSCSSRFKACDVLQNSQPTYCKATGKQICDLPNRFECVPTPDANKTCSYTQYSVHGGKPVFPLPTNATDICNYDDGSSAICSGTYKPV